MRNRVLFGMVCVMAVLAIIVYIVSGVSFADTAFASVETGDIEMPFNMDVGVHIKQNIQDYETNFVITYPTGGIRIAMWYDAAYFNIYVTQGTKSRTVTIKAPLMGFLMNIYYMPAPYNGMYPNISIYPIEWNNEIKGQKLVTKPNQRLTVDGQERTLTKNDDGFYYYNIEFTGFFVGSVTPDYVVSNVPSASIINNTRPKGTLFADWNSLYSFWYDQTKYFVIPALDDVSNSIRAQYQQGYDVGYNNGFTDANSGAGDFWQGAVYTIRTFGNSLAELGNLELAPNFKLSYVVIGIPVLMLIVGLIFRNRGD